jgi:hypothetical protein
MSAQRVQISKKVRFEVFKRDSFTCQYCGAQAPDVILHVDHIHPVSKGGLSDVLNLITACNNCNYGKSDIELSDSSSIAKQKKILNELNEKREQLELLIQWRESLRSIDKMEVDAVANYINECIKGTVNDLGKKEIQGWLKKSSVNTIIDSVDTAKTYLEPDLSGGFKDESLVEFWHKLGALIRISQQPDFMRDLYYIRGICRKRYQYCNDKEGLYLLSQAYQVGIKHTDHEKVIATLKSVVFEANTWSQFKRAINEYF